MLSRSLIVLALSASLASAQSPATGVPANTTATELEYVEAQYNASGFDTALPNSQSFGINLNATGLLTAEFGSVIVQLGQDYTTTQVAALPTLYFTPLEASSLEGQFTVMLADASAVGQPDAEGDYRHYLANNVSFTGSPTDTNRTAMLDLNSAITITAFAGPGPLPNSGIHRYSWLLFQQPDTFTPPADLSTQAAPSHWSVETYVRDSGLGQLVGASFFTVTAEGTASSAAATSSVPSPSASAVPASASNANNAASRAASASTTSSGASKTSVVSVALFGIIAGAVALF